ncbi:MAG: hypothetical protein AAGI17_09545 [Planctomycetota bacterium]
MDQQQATAPTTGSNSPSANVPAWVAQGLVFVIFAVFGPLAKLTASPESVALFEALGPGKPMMYAVGVAELIAMILIVIPKTAWFGAGLSLGTFVGAIGGHVAKIGVVPTFTLATGEEFSPGIVLFAAAVVGLVASAAVLFLRRGEIPVVGAKLAGGTVQPAA